MDKEIKISDKALQDADALITLALKILERHSQCGTDSPLRANQIADLNYRVNIVRDKHDEGLKYKKLMDASWIERDYFIGSKDNGMIQSLIKIVQSLNESFPADKNELSRWGIQSS
jgi:hypothetical protein